MHLITKFVVLCALAVFGTTVQAEVLITEVYYCHGPVDDQYEWIELYNQSVTEVSLDGYRLAHGGADYTWTVIEFGPDDVVAPCETFVVGGPLSTAENAFPVFDLAIDFDENLQNGGTIGDGVALFAPGEPLTGIPLDAVFWGVENAFGLLGPDGQPAVPNVGNVPGYGISITRVDEVGTWEITPAPNPNTIVYIPALCRPIAEDARSWGGVKDDFRFE